MLNNQTPVYLSDLLTYKSHSYYFRYTNTVEIFQVKTSTYGINFSALLLLKYGIPCHKNSAKLQRWNCSGHKFIHGSGVCTCSFCSNC